VLAATPLTHHVLLTRDDTPFVKPDPRHLLAALAALGVAPEQAAMCGDHPLDVAAGRRRARAPGGAGLDGIALAFAAARPDLLVRSVAELGPVHGPRWRMMAGDPPGPVPGRCRMRGRNDGE
jgi:phosphoglycolate phosphatase-like HAD superfamily hydrolase